VSEYEAVRLFEDRAGAAQSGFAVTADNAADVARLVRKLDGIPLAIELAAPLLRAMSLPEIVAALGEFRFGALTDGPSSPRHHRTLWHTFEWSYQLCTPSERLLWTRLAVFAGGFTLAAAVAVAAGPDLNAALIPKTLRDLVAKSVVSADTDTKPTRYALLATVREYGLSRLRSGGTPEHDPFLHGEPGSPAPESGEELAVRRRFHQYYLRQATDHSRQWYGPDEGRHLWEAAQDLPNYRAILDRCAAAETLEDAEMGAGIAITLTTLRLWFFAGSIGEGLRVLLRADDALRRTEGPVATRLTTLAKAGWIALCLGEPATADDLLDRCRSLAPAVVAQEGADVAMANLAFLTASNGLLAHAGDARTGAFALVRADLDAAGDRGTVPMAGLFDALDAAFRSPRDEALELTEKYLAESQACGAVWITSWLELARAVADLRHGTPAEAVSRLRSVLRSQWDIGDRWGPVWCVESLAWAAAAQGRYEDAAVLLGAATGMQWNLGVQISQLEPWGLAHDDCAEQVRTALGPGYDTLESYGAVMAVDDVIDLALGRRSGPRADASTRSELTVLSEKQRAVAELIAEGRTDKQIAAALFLSPRTVQSHVSAILRTLGFSSRTQIAKWMIEQRR
jgi:non-specific serine/threonine protein kinase